MRERIGYMVLGAVLVMCGVFVGQQGSNEAVGQAAVSQGTVQGNTVLFTSSSDGKTLHAWTLTGGDLLLPHISPRVQKSWTHQGLIPVND